MEHKHPSTTGPFLVIERPIFFSFVGDPVNNLRETGTDGRDCVSNEDLVFPTDTRQTDA